MRILVIDIFILDDISCFLMKVPGTRVSTVGFCPSVDGGLTTKMRIHVKLEAVRSSFHAKN